MKTKSLVALVISILALTSLFICCCRKKSQFIPSGDTQTGWYHTRNEKTGMSELTCVRNGNRIPCGIFFSQEGKYESRRMDKLILGIK